MKKTLTLLFLIFISTGAWGQQDPQFSMFMFNKQVFNPGYVGAAGYMQLAFAGRSQWVGIEGHPNTMNFCFNRREPLVFGAYGLHLMSDRIGPFSNTTVHLDYAFRLPLGQGGTMLQIGISPGLYFRNLDGRDMRPKDLEDPLLREKIGTETSSTNFDLNAGLYLYKPLTNECEPGEKFYFGLSVTNLLQPTIDKWTQNFKIARTMYVNAGYRFELKNGIGIEPAVNLKLAEMIGPQYQLDVNCNVHVRPMVFGLSYRGLSNADAIVGMMGFHATQRLFAAYSYDYTLSGLTNVTSGSHEIFLSYIFPCINKIPIPDLDTKQKQIIY